MHFLALGDSYTICTGASAPVARWPSIVGRRLAEALGEEIQVTNLGVNGYTTVDLIRDELPHVGDRAWDFVTVLIGVNDFVQGVSIDAYRDRLARIYSGALATQDPSLAARSARRTAAVSIPDFSYAPVATDFGSRQGIERGLRAFNEVGAEEAARAGLPFIDIFEVSRSRMPDPGWISEDGLHPGDAQYAVWADTIWDAVRSSWTDE